MRLLTVGRSLKGGTFASGKYKVQPTLLPKFASTVRPSPGARRVPVSKANSEAPSLFEKPTVSVDSANAQPISPVMLELEAAGGGAQQPFEKTQKIPAGTVLDRVEEPAVAKERFSFSLWISKYTSSLKKVLFPVRSKRKTNSAPVQTEWSLEKVTVVRNDLSEADIEVVAPKTLVPATKPKLAKLKQIKDSGCEWIKTTSRLFKSTSPFESIPDQRRAKTDRTELAGRI